MFENEAKERARDFTDNKERQVAYECGFLDGADRMRGEMQEQGLALQSDMDKTIEQNMALKSLIETLKEKLAGAERTRDNLRQIGFPTFQSCKEYADKLNYAKAIIKDLLDNSDEYARQRAIDFLKGD